jgi:hypothetical protein
MSPDSEQTALFPDDEGHEPGPMELAIAEMLSELDGNEDGTADNAVGLDLVAVQLVAQYARLLDRASGQRNKVQTYAQLGPKLLAALTALGWTPAGRSGTGGGPGEHVASPVDDLRRRRKERSG